MNWILLPLSPHPHVILHAGLAQSCRIHNFKKQRKTFSLWRSSPSGLDERGGRKFSSLALTHGLRPSSLSRWAILIFWMMDSATSLFGSAQNDRGGGKLRRVKVFGLNKPTKRKSGAMCMSWSLMQCVMTYDWYWVHWFLIETCI